MKITKEDYERLKNAFYSTVVHHGGVKELREYRQHLIDTDEADDYDLRVRWDVMWASGYRWPEYLHDNHMDTALKKIVRELGI